MTSLGLNLNLGTGGAFGPASVSDIVQRLRGGTDDGVSLKYQKQTVASDAELRNVTVLTGAAGSWCDLDSAIQAQPNLVLIFDIYPTTDNSTRYLLGSVTNNTNYIRYEGVGNTTIVSQFSLNGSGGSSFRTKVLDGGIGLTPNQWNRLKITFAPGGFLEYEVNGVSGGSISTAYSTTYQTPIDRFFARGNNSNPFIGKVRESKISGPYTNEYRFEEGYGLTIFDLYRQNDLTLTTADQDASWAGTDDDTPSRNHSVGFSLYEYATLLLATVISGELLNMIPDLTQVPI
jgi:hypothetical protein